jgi:hypothetical protein
MAAGQLGQAHAVGFDQAGAGISDTIEKLPHPRIAPGRIHIDFDNRLRRGLEAHAHGMKSEQNFG